MTIVVEHAQEILANAGIFQSVEPTVVSALTKQLHPVDFLRGHTIFAEGEPGDKLYIIIAGKVKIGRRAPDGRENLLTIMGPSDMFGELSIFDPGPRTSSATTITETRAVSMDREALRAWIAERPEIAEQLFRVLARRLRRTNNSLADLIFTDVSGRVAKLPLQLAGRFGTQGGNALRVRHDLTQEEIAQLVGSSRETVNKALSDFAHRGSIRTKGKTIVIMRLRAFGLPGTSRAGIDCAAIHFETAEHSDQLGQHMYETDTALLIIRISFGLTMFAHGWNKFTGKGGVAGTGRWFDSIGMRPGLWHARIAAMSEVVAGIGLVAGFLTPVAAAGFVALMLVAGWTVHRTNGFFIVKEGWEYNFVLATGAVAIAGLGAGRFSLDAFLFPDATFTAGWTGMGIAVVLGVVGSVGQLVLFYRPASAS